MNSNVENPFGLENGEQLADTVFDASYIFNVKTQKFLDKSRMQVARARHFSCIYVDPNDVTNRMVVAAGGVTISRKVDLFRKKKTQTFHDNDSVEVFSFSENRWETFNACLSIARHSASICELKGHLYVIGGHRVDLPNEFICSIERCPVRCF